MPYWLSWLIYIAGLAAACSVGYTIGFWRGTDKEFWSQQAQRDQLHKLVRDSHQRSRELSAFLDEAHQQFLNLKAETNEQLLLHKAEKLHDQS
jgi:hypothetical protein